MMLWDIEIIDLINSIDKVTFPQKLIKTLAVLVPFTMSTIIINRGRSRPINHYDTFPDAAAKAGIDNYIQGSYVLNPFYRAHLNGLKLGVYRIGDLAPDGYFSNRTAKSHKVIMAPDEEIGYMTESWPKGYEELDIAIPIDDITFEIGLYSNVEKGGFDEADIEILSSKVPIIDALVQKYWQLRSDNIVATPRDNSIDDAFESFGSSKLSSRESEVIQYVLRGHSSESIALNLEISITTVKTHRKRAYSKLDISSQSELFSQFLKSVDINFRSAEA